MKPELRPTTNKVLEALFSMLSEKVAGSNFLDLFAGSGSIGIEALCRGASFVVFGEKSGLYAARLRDAVKRGGWGDNALVIRGDAIIVLKKLDRRFDLIFLDPPYKGNLAEKSLEYISEADLIATSGWVIVEHHHKNPPSCPKNMLELFKQKSYGETRLSFFRKVGEESPA